MSMRNRYLFTKDYFKNYLVLIKRGNNYYSYDGDKKILDYIKFNDKLSILRKLKINFIILDDLEIIGTDSYEVNNYYKYLYIAYISDILLGIKRSICLK